MGDRHRGWDSWLHRPQQHSQGVRSTCAGSKSAATADGILSDLMDGSCCCADPAPGFTCNRPGHPSATHHGSLGARKAAVDGSNGDLLLRLLARAAGLTRDTCQAARPLQTPEPHRTPQYTPACAHQMQLIAVMQGRVTMPSLYACAVRHTEVCSCCASWLSCGGRVISKSARSAICRSAPADHG